MDVTKLKEQTYRTGDGIFALDLLGTLIPIENRLAPVQGDTLGELKGK